MKSFSSKGNRFSGDSIESCVDFIDLVDRLKIPDIKLKRYFTSIFFFIYKIDNKMIKGEAD